VLERTRYKKHRSECARRYRGLLENSSESIYTHDLRGHPTSVSKAFEQMIGYTQEEILNTNFGKILSAECVDLVWRSILRMLEDRKPASCEAVLVTREGERIPVGVTMHLVFEKGGPVEVQGIVRDLSPPPAATPIAESDQCSRVILTL
jgi:PAS domain S-box-containing protein